MENHYFKTAEFAALCGVRKDTLLHYDHIGLLKPQWVGENGYRYYAAQQLRTYDLIAALRRLGTPWRRSGTISPAAAPRRCWPCWRRRRPSWPKSGGGWRR